MTDLGFSSDGYAPSRSGCANAQAKRQDRNDGKAGALPQHPQPITKVLPKARHLFTSEILYIELSKTTQISEVFILPSDISLLT